jgi:uncharacterized protein YndB with AHSA1/START domain
MPVKKHPSGKRSIGVETEVPGTPEEVWQAIATGPGVTSWFAPCRIEGREGGAIVLDFGPGMESKATVTAWDPPRRFVAENPGGMGPGSPTMTTEWTIEALSGGVCRVRVVHSWFASTDDWDSQFESVEQGWPAFFRILKLYLVHFRGRSCSQIQLMPFSQEPKDKAWAALMEPLGLVGVAVGQSVKSAAGAPSVSGVVERIGESDDPEELLLRLEQPAPGIAHLFAMPMGGQTCLSVRFYLYGEQAQAVVAREEPVWQAWLQRLFPSAPTGTETEATKP